MSDPGPVFVLLSKPGCHLCHEMRQVVEPVLAELGASLVERDVRDDPEKRRRYLLEIPVLLLGDEEVARHRIAAGDLRERLARLIPRCASDQRSRGGRAEG